MSGRSLGPTGRCVLRLALAASVAGGSLIDASDAEAAPWIAAGAVARGDFDGDGNLDTVASSPESDGNEGAVWVTDGATGAAGRWTRDTSGLAGAGASADDYFGAAVAVGDFDGDAYDDLVVSAPGASDAGPAGSGVIHVIYGSSSGLTTSGDQIFHQATTGIQGVPEAGDQVGDVLAVGDFDCDGYDDIVIGVPMEAISSATEAGSVHVLYGSSSGVSTVNDLYYQGAGGVNGVAETDDHFGGALVAGNFNGDSSSSVACDDLAIGVPDEAIGTIASAGYVYVILGGTSGLSTTGDFAVHQDVTGVEDAVEVDDRFGLRLFSHDEDGDGNDDLFVVVPGDSCISGHGEARALFYGSSTGISLTGNTLACHSYLCNIDEAERNDYWCHSQSPAVYASEQDDIVRMFVGDDIVFASAGADDVRGAWGDDIIFGGAGNDVLHGGPGADAVIGGAGNDSFVIDLTCQAQPGEVLDGGPGADTVRSHLDRSQLQARGVSVSSIESFVTIPANPIGEIGCATPPYEEGPLLPPKAVLKWDDLPAADSVFTTTAGLLDLLIENTSGDAITVALTFRLTVRGWVVEQTPSPIALNAFGQTSYELDLADFIPTGVDPQVLPSSMLELPTSAVLTAQAEIIVSSEHAGMTYAPVAYGHLEDGDEAVLYREKALKETYYGGDLLGWRAQLSHSPSAARVIHARTVPIPPT